MKAYIQAAAEEDIMQQVEWYASKFVPDIAARFSAPCIAGINAILTMPNAGPPRATNNPLLAGLRTWPVREFDAFKIYYPVRGDQLIIVRILRGKRDTDMILAGQSVDTPDGDG